MSNAKNLCSSCSLILLAHAFLVLMTFRLLIEPNSSRMSKLEFAPVKGKLVERHLYCVNSDTYDQAASNVVTSNGVEQTIQHILDIGGGSWDKETVTRALQAAYNNPDTVEVADPLTQLLAFQAATAGAPGAAPFSGGPNSPPLNLFPQEIPSGATGGNLGSLDFLRNNQQCNYVPCLLHGLKAALLVTAYASGAGKAKSSAFRTNSGEPC
ncbi:Heat shock chaperonin-binding [Artemisia annua]|uniref:Heat shock chaperonin-binding n=1 Tax=Artemisia annua TaxID=35608 RepID=A0A2U1NP60_ARTAN|nr:Heat shock chaperonin-binding [Artemisia annua]